MPGGKVEILFLGDSRSIERATGSLVRSLDKAEGRLERTGRTLSKWGDRMTVGVTAPLLLLGKHANDAASQLQQSTGAIESVLGSASRKVIEFSETSADSFGISKREARQMGAVIGASLTGMGYDVNEAADTVVGLEKRAADMAATFGGTTSEAIESMASLLRGERDPIEKYGVSIKQADVNARILALGLDTSTVAAEKKATAVASLDLLMEQTAKTAGQFAREEDTAAGAAARAAATTEDAAAALGDALLPITAKAAGQIADLAGSFQQLSPEVQENIVKIGLLAAASGPLMSLGGRILTLSGHIADGARKLKQMHEGISLMRGLAGKTTPSLGALAGAVTGVGLAIAAAVTVYTLWKRRQEEARQRVEALTDAIIADNDAIGDNTSQLVANRLAEEGLLDAADRLGVSYGTLTAAALGNTDAQAVLQARIGEVRDEVAGQNVVMAENRDALMADVDATHQLEGGLGRLGEEMGEARQAADQQSRALDAAEAATRELEGAQGDLETQTEDTTQAIRDEIDATRAMVSPVFGAYDALNQLEAAQRSTTAALEEHGAQSPEYQQALLDEAQAGFAADAALRTLIADFKENNRSAADFRGALQRLVAQDMIDEAAAARAMEMFGQVTDRAESLEGVDPTVHVRAQTADARGDLHGFDVYLNQVTRPRTVRISTVTEGGTTGGLVRHQGGLVDDTPGRRAPGPLRSDERLVVAKVGEEWLTEDDPRHIRNIDRTERRHAGGITGGPSTRPTAAGTVIEIRQLHITLEGTWDLTAIGHGGPAAHRVAEQLVRAIERVQRGAHRG